MLDIGRIIHRTPTHLENPMEPHRWNFTRNRSGRKQRFRDKRKRRIVRKQARTVVLSTWGVGLTCRYLLQGIKKEPGTVQTEVHTTTRAKTSPSGDCSSRCPKGCGMGCLSKPQWKNGLKRVPGQSPAARQAGQAEGTRQRRSCPRRYNQSGRREQPGEKRRKDPGILFFLRKLRLKSGKLQPRDSNPGRANRRNAEGRELWVVIGLLTWMLLNVQQSKEVKGKTYSSLGKCQE